MKKLISIFCLLLLSSTIVAQKERFVHYVPDGGDFVCVNPTMRFNRALYGTSTAFRVEAGDLPEFAMYMPGMGGNLRFALQRDDKRKWLINADSIRAAYRAGSMIYEIKDALLGTGKLYLTVLALSNAEGLVLQVKSENISADVNLVWLYGGASGKKFSRDGDIGADPESSFYLKMENCSDNRYQLLPGKFILSYGTGKVLTEEERYEIQSKPESQLAGEKLKEAKKITGIYPPSSSIRLIDASNLDMVFGSADSAKKDFCIGGKLKLGNTKEFFLLHNSATLITKNAEQEFDDAEAARRKLAGRVKLVTPDKYLNTIGSALSIAADAIWESPSYMHGAVAWRMRLNGWRGAYIADVLGWHDRAKEHFNGYAASQLTAAPVKGVVMDTALHLARHLEKIGTALFSDGYISRNPNDSTKAHHYDMNLVFIDQLLNHFNWTGDTNYVRSMWPLIKRHLAWEKRNFDSDNDGLYDSYAAIWASDALQYSGGGVTHSSAYNYRTFKYAVFIAGLLGEDPSPYQQEADKIFQAVNKELWLKSQGWYAEYKDLLGNKLLHTSPGLWTIYHAIDEGISDPFQSYQTLNFIDRQLPHIPIRVKGLPDTSLYTLPTTNWQPYTWSLNNVALAELLHTSLAYWQAGRSEDAFRLWKSSLMESMYLGASPGNIQQLSYYDAIRGELYRDFADPIAMAGRSLVEGLFGIHPNALRDSLEIVPGFPSGWDSAAISTPDIDFSFRRNGNKEFYSIRTRFKKAYRLTLKLPVLYTDVAAVKMNGKPVSIAWSEAGVGKPSILLRLPANRDYAIAIEWKGTKIETTNPVIEVNDKGQLLYQSKNKRMLELYDPQNALRDASIKSNELRATASSKYDKLCFVKLQQGKAVWWQALTINAAAPAFVNDGLRYEAKEKPQFEMIDLSAHFNDKLKDIFKHSYLSPRPIGPTLQLPVQGIGNWAYPLIAVDINDSGLRNAAANKSLQSKDGIPFQSVTDTLKNNVVFTSQWDNFPKSHAVSIRGKGSHIHLLLAGSTNAMQSRITNGRVVVKYADQSADTLELVNPINWWPIEQDFFINGLAFNAGKQRPERFLLKKGEFIQQPTTYYSIKGFSNFGIDGGAANVLHMKIDPQKQLQELKLETVANDVIIGLVAATIER